MGHLKSGRTKSCGCYNIETRTDQRENIIGKKYNRLTIISEADPNKWNQRQVQAKCSCDENISIYILDLLRREKIKSCGCLLREKYRKKDYKEKHPLFTQIEEIMDDPDVPGILVRCKKCNEWFKPTARQIRHRIDSLEKQIGFEERNFYCSPQCKKSCILFNLKSDPFKKIDFNKPIGPDIRIWRKEVLENQRKEHGKNFCEYCEKEHDTYHVHHEKPQKMNWIFSLDPDNGVVTCKECHYKYAHKDECSPVALANKICRN